MASWLLLSGRLLRPRLHLLGRLLLRLLGVRVLSLRLSGLRLLHLQLLWLRLLHLQLFWLLWLPGLLLLLLPSGRCKFRWRIGSRRRSGA